MGKIGVFSLNARFYTPKAPYLTTNDLIANLSQATVLRSKAQLVLTHDSGF